MSGQCQCLTKAGARCKNKGMTAAGKDPKYCHLHQKCTTPYVAGSSPKLAPKAASPKPVARPRTPPLRRKVASPPRPPVKVASPPRPRLKLHPLRDPG